MLTALRTKATSWILKIILGLIAISFAIWGIGDIFRVAPREQPVAEVGSMTILRDQFQSEYRRELNRLRDAFGGRLTAEQARQLGLPEQVLGQMVTRTLYAVHADRMGMTVPDDVVRQAILQEPAFRNSLGQFDRLRFEQILRQNELTEAGYVALLRRDLLRSQVADAVAAGAHVPQTLLERLYRHRAERRVAEVLVVPDASVETPASPDEATLAAFHEEHAERYQAPEYRTVTVIRISPDDLLDEIEVPEEELRAEYEARKSQFETPERRRLSQIVLPDEETARAAAGRLAEGADLAAVAAEAGGSGPVDLGLVDRRSILPELAEAAFATPLGQVSQPVESPLGWHILRVEAVEPGSTRAFEEVREELRRELARAEAVDDVIGLANQFEDSLAGGASVEEAAAALNLPASAVTTDPAGRTPAGEPAGLLAEQEALRALAFGMEPGAMSPLEATADGGYALLRLDEIRPAATRPLAEVRDQVLADWQAAERARLAAARAEAIAERVRGGADLRSVAEAEGLSVQTSQPFTRRGEGGGALVGELAAQLFAIPVGGVVTGRGANGHLVAELAEIRPADPAADAAQLEELRGLLRRSMTGDLLAQFGAALRQRIEVTTDAAVLESALPQ